MRAPQGGKGRRDGLPFPCHLFLFMCKSDEAAVRCPFGSGPFRPERESNPAEVRVNPKGLTRDFRAFDKEAERSVRGLRPQPLSGGG